MCLNVLQRLGYPQRELLYTDMKLSCEKQRYFFLHLKTVAGYKFQLQFFTRFLSKISAIVCCDEKTVKYLY